MKRFSGRGTRRRYNAGYGQRPSRTWSSLASRFSLSSVTATTAQVLISLEAPTDLSALTSDPPEDLTILRIVGTYSIAVAQATVGGSVLAMLVQDQTWTPSTAFATDADKRILWHRTYAGLPAGYNLTPPGRVTDSTGATVFATEEAQCSIDISPKVKIEPGKALFLVYYESSASAAEVSVGSFDMRVLYQRTGRPR